MLPLTAHVPLDGPGATNRARVPVQAERDQHERRFLRMGRRQMMLYDKLGGGTVSTRKTPEVVVAPRDQSRIALLETSRLQVTGRPAREIRSEVRQRQERVRAVLKGTKLPTTLARRQKTSRRALCRERPLVAHRQPQALHPMTLKGERHDAAVRAPAEEQGAANPVGPGHPARSL